MPDDVTLTESDLDAMAGTDAGRPGRLRMKETAADREVAEGARRVAAAELRQFVERVETVEAEKRELADQIKEIYAEAKARGYDTKAMRQVVSRRRMDRDERAERDAMLDLYESTLGQ